MQFRYGAESDVCAFSNGEQTVMVHFTPQFGDPVSHSLTFTVDKTGPKVLGASASDSATRIRY